MAIIAKDYDMHMQNNCKCANEGKATTQTTIRARAFGHLGFYILTNRWLSNKLSRPIVMQRYDT